MARQRIRLVLDGTVTEEMLGGALPNVKTFVEADGYLASIPAGQAGGYQSFTPTNGANTLTDAQSWAEYLVALTGLTGVATVQSTQPFSVFARQKFRNQTGQVITFKWAGDATGVAIAAGASVDIRCNGTIAVAGLVGT